MSEYEIRYPSGRTFTISGSFQRIPLGEMIVPAVVLESGEVMVLDQRAVVILGDAVLYTPKMNLDGLDPGISAWLWDNLNWPPVFK